MHEEFGTVIKICGGGVGLHASCKLATAKRSYSGKLSQITIPHSSPASRLLIIVGLPGLR